jgi:hypothetical protein
VLAASWWWCARILTRALSLTVYSPPRKKWYWFPESVMSMLIGAVSGFLILIFDRKEVEKLIFDPQLFFFILLPPM